MQEETDKYWAAEDQEAYAKDYKDNEEGSTEKWTRMQEVFAREKITSKARKAGGQSVAKRTPSDRPSSARSSKSENETEGAKGPSPTSALSTPRQNKYESLEDESWTLKVGHFVDLKGENAPIQKAH